MVSLLPPNYPKTRTGRDCPPCVFRRSGRLCPTSEQPRSPKNRGDRRQSGITGGINLADEYVNRKIRFGHWKDTAIMLEGDAVRSFTLMFLEMWNVAKKSEKVEEFDPYLDVIYERKNIPAKVLWIPLRRQSD